MNSGLHMSRTPRKKDVLGQSKVFWALLILIAFLGAFFFLLPSVVTWKQTNPGAQSPFPLGVDPINKTINETQAAAILFSNQVTPLQAAAAGADNFFIMLARAIASSNVYQWAAVAGDVPQVVTINPGMRKEQIATVFGKVLAWDPGTKKMFLQLPPISNEDLNDGTIAPGDYAVAQGSSLLQLQTQVKNRFSDTILSRYTPAIQKVVPLNEGLTIASILERETNDPDEMRIISGIIWNRIFSGMKLQMDSTLQYAKATGHGTWWPQVVPRDKYIDSPYNTYQNEGVPPGPIAEPSVAAVLAALNPKNTTCLYYFHDDNSDFHCSDTYPEHVALLKKYYGRGK